MKLSKLAVKRPVTTIMMMLLIVIVGFVSFTNLHADLMPNVNPPVIAVMTTYPGAGPEEVAEMVTKPVEEAVGTSAGLETMQSRSSSNSSLVIATYEWGSEMSEIRDDLNNQLSMLQLPDDVSTPMLIKFDPTMMPILQFAVSHEGDIEELQHIVQQEVIPQIQSTSGVANVTLTGGFDEQIVVNLDENKLKEYQLSQQQIVQLIQGNSLTLPGGIIEDRSEKLNLRVMGKTESLMALKQLPVHVRQSEHGLDVITLEEIAEIHDSVIEMSSAARQNGENSLLIDIQKEATANTAEVSELVREQLSEIEKEHPTLSMVISSDQGEMIERSVSNVTKALLFGAIFAISVIIVFLRSPSSTLIVAVAIPFSIISTFVMMYFSGMTLNIMSLGGLALGVGMLVDNAIVVIENIYRHLSLENNRKDAAVKGATEVGGAITASMLTTISVFLPIVFVGGMVGDLFQDLALSVTFALLSSWLIALTVVPALSGLILNPKKAKKTKERRTYQRLMNGLLNHRLVTLTLTFIVLVGSAFLAPQLGTEFLPAQDEGAFSIEAQLYEGAPLPVTQTVVEEIEQVVRSFSDIEVITANIGQSDPLMAAAIGSGENQASFNVRLVEADNRSASTEEVMNQIEKELAHLEDEGVELNFSLSNSMQAMSGAPNQVEILLLGQNKEQLNEYTEELQERLTKNEAVNAVTSSIQSGKPEYHFIVDKEKAFQYGLTSAQVGSFVREMLQGQVATKISEEGVETDVIVQIEGVSNSKEAIENLSMATPVGQEVQLKEIGELIRGEGPITIVRENQEEAVTLTVAYDGLDMGRMTNDIQKEMEQLISDYDINTNLYTIKVSGGAEMMEDAFSSMIIALVLAIVFVYMIMASQFESLLQPLIIMFSMPLAITGVILGLFVTDYAFGITAFIGIIILAGVVVNNAIVFVDYTNQLRGRGLEIKEALIEAGKTRLRPIIMTALTTMLGLFPLAVGTGEGTALQAPMAIAVIGGLFSSTLLTLVIIPVIYSLIESMKKSFRNRLLAFRK